MPIQELLIYQTQFFKYMLSLVTCRRLVAISVTVWASRKLGMKIKVNFAIRNRANLLPVLYCFIFASFVFFYLIKLLF